MIKCCWIADPMVMRSGEYFLTKIDDTGKKCNQMQFKGFSSYKEATDAADKKNKKNRLSEEDVDEMVIKSIDEKGEVIDTIER